MGDVVRAGVVADGHRARQPGVGAGPAHGVDERVRAGPRLLHRRRAGGLPGGATHAVLSPGGLTTLLEDGAPTGLAVVVAGDGLSPRLASRAARAGLVVHHYYGAAELSFVAWGSHRDDLRPFPGAAVSVRDGEVWVRSPYLCLGYDGADGPLRRDGDGWATVGDRGTLEPDGRLVVHGRPDAVTTGGATVRLSEVEAVLRTVARGEVAVLGVPHPDLGAVLVAVLTDPSDRDALVVAARDELTAAARPRRWYHRDTLPRTVGREGRPGSAGGAGRDRVGRDPRADRLYRGPVTSARSRRRTRPSSSGPCAPRSAPRGWPSVTWSPPTSRPRCWRSWRHRSTGCSPRRGARQLHGTGRRRRPGRRPGRRPPGGGARADRGPAVRQRAGRGRRGRSARAEPVRDS